MKKLLLLSTILSLLTGCKLMSPQTAIPPTETERRFFDVTNSIVERIVVKTNWVTATVTNVEARVVTNEVNVPVVQWRTNFIDIPVQRTVLETQHVEVPQLLPGVGSRATTEIGTTIGNFFGVGGLVGGLLGGSFAAYMRMRNRALRGENTALEIATGGLVETTETLLNLLRTTPQGQELLPIVKAYLERHQDDLGTLEIVRENLSLISKAKSLDDAQEIIDKLKATVTRSDA